MAARAPRGLHLLGGSTAAPSYADNAGVQPRLAVRPMGFVRSSDLADLPIAGRHESRALCQSGCYGSARTASRRGRLERRRTGGVKKNFGLRGGAGRVPSGPRRSPCGLLWGVGRAVVVAAAAAVVSSRAWGSIEPKSAVGRPHRGDVSCRGVSTAPARRRGPGTGAGDGPGTGRGRIVDLGDFYSRLWEINL